MTGNFLQEKSYNFFHLPFHRFSIIFFCISGDLYFILELGTDLSTLYYSISSCFGHMTQNCHGITFVFGIPPPSQWQYFEDRKESTHRLSPSQWV